ncbi:hypothetical protein BABINDRAFT_123078 [Babjeviella inositovora NRRL Y-12698]|uniref:Required for respiratory growth protein 8, mitochondrial n=1 Tax=Babjeviella inositovora NRRL Y-12698 TaxID=984486 RepID=A0A1E3QUF7_9ASCO|nr:uncharacterized protein BABINDRAFT_123078 [Babjeviella inositovora NRRL Y-12698]ODQ81331.1 hypothetical protein BABINDRAFT_123078 [Babjeviella inositovora NRRL Y-12698]
MRLLRAIRTSWRYSGAGMAFRSKVLILPLGSRFVSTYKPKAPACVSPLVSRGDKWSRKPPKLHPSARVDRCYPDIKANPFARPLLSPPRFDTLSRRKIPRDFMLPMAVVQGESTKAYLMPFFEEAHVRSYAPNKRQMVRDTLNAVSGKKNNWKVFLPMKVKLNKDSMGAYDYAVKEDMEVIVHEYYKAKVMRMVESLVATGSLQKALFGTISASDKREFAVLAFGDVPAVSFTEIRGKRVAHIGVERMCGGDVELVEFLKLHFLADREGPVFLKLNKATGKLVAMMVRFSNYNEI